MKYDYDVLTIGLGPGGMAVSGMAKAMGLRVATIERERIGGECMNVGCIPSKAILRVAKTRHQVHKYEAMALAPTVAADVFNPFEKIQAKLSFINEQKNKRMLEGVDMIWGTGSFVDKRTVKVNDRQITARRIFICAGTLPAFPPIEGIEDVETLTNRNIFHLDAIPPSMTVLGGGAIACEMAQAFSRLGTKVTVVIRGERLMQHAHSEMVDIIEEVFAKEGIEVRRNTKMSRVHQDADGIHLTCGDGSVVTSSKLLVATGRRRDYSDLNLGAAGVELNDQGCIKVNGYLETTCRHVYGVGDCNGHFLFSHAAMHQGMIAIMNSIAPRLLRKDFRKYVVPYTMFTEPQISWVGETHEQLKKRGVKAVEVRTNYADYGAAIAEHVTEGFVKVLTTKRGRILGAGVIGEGSADLINEWGLAIQQKMRITDVMFLQHSFPSMSFLNKRVSEIWMTRELQNASFVKSVIGYMIRGPLARA